MEINLTMIFVLKYKFGICENKQNLAGTLNLAVQTIVDAGTMFAGVRDCRLI